MHALIGLVLHVGIIFIKQPSVAFFWANAKRTLKQ